MGCFGLQRRIAGIIKSFAVGFECEFNQQETPVALPVDRRYKREPNFTISYTNCFFMEVLTISKAMEQ